MIARKVIKEKGLTMEEVADRMGIGRVTLHQLLSKQGITTTTLRRLAEAIGCQIGDFFVDEMTTEIESHDITCSCPHCGKKLKISLDAV